MVQYGTVLPRHVSLAKHVHKLLYVKWFVSGLEIKPLQYLPSVQSYQEMHTSHFKSTKDD